MTIVYFSLGALGLSLLYWWFIGRNTPKYPPLHVADDDPRMLAAIEKARASLDTLRSLVGSSGSQIQVKVAFVSNGGVTEHLWAELIELSSTEMDVRYLAPPVSHTGKLERLAKHAVEDIEDWAVFTESGQIHGGYTQRLMFDLAREQYGGLPKELAEQEGRYA